MKRLLWPKKVNFGEGTLLWQPILWREIATSWHSPPLLGRLLRVDLITLVGLKCPSVGTSVRPSTKSFFDFNEIWYVSRGRRVTHDCMQYDPIQCQDYEPMKVGNSTIFKGYLLPIYNRAWQMTTDSKIRAQYLKVVGAGFLFCPSLSRDFEVGSK